MEKILVVLGTEHFMERHFRLAAVDPVTRDRIPRHGKRAGILDVNLGFEFITAFDERNALDNMGS